MKYNVVYLNPAMQDVTEIRNYLSQFYPNTPMKFLTALKKGIENICTNPYIYPEYEDNASYRKMIILDYIVFYKVHESEMIVEIHRVLYGMRDINAYLPKSN